MSYSISISGHVDSKAAEAAVLEAAADCAEKIGAAGSFSFSGQHFGYVGGPNVDAVAQARELVAAYNADADADDQVAQPGPGHPAPEESAEPPAETPS